MVDLNMQKTFIHKFILTDIEHKKLFYDCKTSLQEVVQGHYEEELNYSINFRGRTRP